MVGRILSVGLGVLAGGWLGWRAEGASSVRVEWDGSSDPNVVGYVLYHGAIGGSGLNAIDTGRQTSGTVSNLFGGTTNFFYVVAYSSEGVPSVPSSVAEVSFAGTYLAPRISAVADQSMEADSLSEPISVVVEDAQWPAERLSLWAGSSNPDLIPETNIAFEGSDSNRTVRLRPSFGQFGSALITLGVDDGIATASTSFQLRVNPPAAERRVYMLMEAEAGHLVAPMRVFEDATAAEGRFIGTLIDSVGSASFGVESPFLSSCVIWCRVRSTEAKAASYIVSVDGGREDVYDVALEPGSNEWQWSVVNGRGDTELPPPIDGSPINPRVFALAVGPHGISFQSQQTNAELDQILITNDPDYVPTGMVTTVELSVPPAQRVSELNTLVVTNRASGLHDPTNTVVYSLLSAPFGMVLDAETGVVSWTPSEAQGPSENLVTVQLTERGSPSYVEVRSFEVTVSESNRAPVLSVPPDQTVDELSTLVLTNRGVDLDLPANRLSYSLVRGPEGMGIDALSGVVVWTPSEAQGPSTNLVTVRVTDDGTPALSDEGSFTVVVNEVNEAPVLGQPPDRAIHQLSTLVWTNTASDADVPANRLRYSLVSAPAGVSLDADSGVLVWTPSEGQRPSSNVITVRVSDDGTPVLSDSKSFTVVVNEENSAPVLSVPPDQSIKELSTLVVTNTAIDPDLPVNGLTFSLVSAPAGTTLDAQSGILTWTPSEAQGPSTNVITVQVSDDGTPALSESKSFTVVVEEVNRAPELPAQGDRTINELTTLTVTNTASDGDLPANELSYQLVSGPAGASIDSSGVISWRPEEAQGPSTNEIMTVVSDNGTPALKATNRFTVVVREVNSAPVLPAQSNRTINEQTQLVVTNTASDGDLPANELTYQLVSPPAGASISASGVISWTPSEAQGPGSATLTTIVTDNGTPALSATNTFTVSVLEVNRAPVLSVPPNKVIHGLASLVLTNRASDPDLPTNTLSFSLLSGPEGVSLDPSSGVLSWTPSEGQLPSTNLIRIGVVDNGSPPRGDSASFLVIVSEDAPNNAPVLTAMADQTVDEQSPLVLTNAAVDPDVPADRLTFELLSGPAGMTLEANTGVLRWTPDEAQGPSTNRIRVKVSDNGVPPLSSTNEFSVVVNEVNRAPVLTVPPDQTIAELSTLVLTNTASDADLPANALSFRLLSAPEGVSLDPDSGVLSWTPGEGQGPSTNVITVQVSDDGQPPLSATNRFTIVVNEVNTAPRFLEGAREVRVDEESLLVLDNPAVDADLPSNTLTWSLLGAPEGMSILPALGIVLWTPTEAQGPSTNLVSIQVSDNGSPPLSAVKNVTVIVNEVNRAPVLLPQGNRTINELTTLVLTNTATDPDLPANTLRFGLASGPSGVSVDPVTGVLTWIPTEDQGPSTNMIKVKVTDNGTPALSATNSFTVVVKELNTAPVLGPIGNQAAGAGTQFTITISATDTDIPPNQLSYSLESPSPAGAQINPTNGVFRWTPKLDLVTTTNVVTVRVTDDGMPGLSATRQFTIVVVSPPVIEGIEASGKTVTIRWSALVGTTYRLQFKSDQSEATWTDLPGDVTAQGPTVMKTDVIEGESQRYYRVIIRP